MKKQSPCTPIIKEFLENFEGNHELAMFWLFAALGQTFKHVAKENPKLFDEIMKDPLISLVIKDVSDFTSAGDKFIKDSKKRETL